jgi:hypothetical protein
MAAALLVPGCAGIMGSVAPAPPPVCPSAARGVILCVPGAGGFPNLCQYLQQAIDEEHLPLAVEYFEWTHGYFRIVADLLASGYAHEQGRKLAERICTLKQECPGRAVYIVSHSAGSVVALTAVENLPPGYVERLVLLAPAVSMGYDLRPALARTTAGVDVFYSRRDWGVLGLGTAILGTADRTWCPPAGRVGFMPEAIDPGDAALFAKLRQHPWDPCLTWAGNGGGHYGTYQPTFLRAYILPLLSPGNS